MPVYTWSKLKQYPVTPAYSVALGTFAAGEKLICINTEFKSEISEGVVGAKVHSHPEEQIIVVIEGEMMIELNGKKTLMEEGDVAVVPPYTPHCTYSNGKPYKQYNIKDRINGHSVYTYGAWEPGAEEHYKKIEALLEESKKFPIKDPWFEEEQIEK